MHNSYFHYCANCIVQQLRPVPYVRWLKIINKIEMSNLQMR